MHSLFKQCELFLNGSKIGDNLHYSYRSYIDTLVGFSNDAKKSHLSSVNYEPKKLSTLKKVPGQDYRNLNLIGVLHMDPCFQGKSFIGGLACKLVLYPNPPKFYFTTVESGPDAVVEYIDASLYLHRSKVSSDLLVAHQRALAQTPARYPMTRTEVKMVTLHKGSIDATIDNIVLGQLPRRMFVCFVGHDECNGNKTKNPLEFKHFNVNYLCAFLGGDQYPRKAYTPNFREGNFVRKFTELYRSINQLSTDCTCAIDQAAFENGSTVFGLNFAPDLSDGASLIGHTNVIKHGALRLMVKFENSLEEAINVVCYMEFDSLIEIDANRKVMIDRFNENPRN